MDWYEIKNKDGSVNSAFWREGSNNIKGYTNVGSGYNLTIGNTSYTFDQNNVISITDNVLLSDSWVSQEKESRTDGIDVQCFTAAKEMLETVGLETSASDIQILTLVKDPKGLAKISENANTAFNLMKKTVGKGDAMIVGVDYDDVIENSGNRGGITNHWVTLSSITYNLINNSISFGFFDPRTKHKELKGTSSTNRLIYSNGKYSGGFYKVGDEYSKKYTISSVRPNKYK